MTLVLLCAGTYAYGQDASSSPGEATAEPAAPIPKPPPDWLTDEKPHDEARGDDSADEPLARPWRLPPIPLRHPRVFDAATARILPAAVIYSGAGIDSGGNASGITMIGLGDVADFAVTSTSSVRARIDALSAPQTIMPYMTAQLRMGIDERRMFRHQPAVVIGYRKSFEREQHGFKSRIAELFLVASKRIGDSVGLHVGGTLWDASLLPVDGGVPVFLHDDGLGKQIRGTFAVEIDANPDAQIMLESFWAPEFHYDTSKLELTAKFAFGVRFVLTDWAVIESGVSVPDIEGRNLLQAQIFGRLRFITNALATRYQEVK